MRLSAQGVVGLEGSQDGSSLVEFLQHQAVMQGRVMKKKEGGVET